jgi:cysteine desulfurase
VLEAMMPYLTDVYYNASSSHVGGLQAQQAVMKARMDIAKHIGARMNDIVFTSGATEAINLALFGLVRGNANRKRIVTVASEHKAVLDSCEHCLLMDVDVVFLGVDSNGRIDLDEVRNAVNDNTLVLSVMAVNNETGVMQELKALAEIAHAHGALFMTDATQAYGKVKMNVDELGIDLMTFSAHKIYGPKGVGALYRRTPKEDGFNIEPLLFGGGQENGIRSGTLNVPGIVGLGAAGNIAHAEMNEESKRIAALRDAFEQAMINTGSVKVNGSNTYRSYNISNITFTDSEPDKFMLDLGHIACSKGSACSSAKPKPSHVLSAMGRTPDEANRSLRFSFGRFTTEQEIQQIIHDMSAAVVGTQA